MTTPPEVLAYIRTSTNEQARKFSPASQRHSISVYAKSNGDKIGEWLEDHETATTINRKRFQEICRRVQAGQVRKLYFNFVDRAFRNTEDALRTAREFQEKGCKLFFSDMPGIDLSTPMGKLMFTHYASFGEFEHARIRQRSMENRLRKMDDTGKPDSWNLGMGFSVIDGYPALNDKIEIVKSLFDLRDQNKSVYEISGIFEKQGKKPLRAELFYPSTLTAMLRNEQYIGKYHRCDRDFAILDREGNLLQPIDPEQFYRVRSKMDHVWQALVGAHSDNYLLRGFVWCEEPCTARWTTNSTSPREGQIYRYYLCGKLSKRNPLAPVLCASFRIQAEPFENHAWTKLWTYVSDPDRVRKGTEALQREERAKMQSSGRDPIGELEKERAKIPRILDQEERGDLTREQSIQKLHKLKLKIAKLEVEARALARVIEIPSLNMAEKACRAIARGPEPEGYEDRREVLEHLADLKITMGKEEATITGGVPVGGEKISSNSTKRLTGTDNFFAPLPFEIKVPIRAA